MSDLRTAAQQALAALEMHVPQYLKDRGYPPITALRAALAEPVQEPVGYANERDLEQMRRHGGGALLWGKDQLDDLSGYTPLYTVPPQRKPLTEEEIIDAVRDADIDWARGWTLDETQGNRFAALARAIERAHGIV